MPDLWGMCSQCAVLGNNIPFIAFNGPSIARHLLLIVVKFVKQKTVNGCLVTSELMQEFLKKSQRTKKSKISFKRTKHGQLCTLLNYLIT